MSEKNKLASSLGLFLRRMFDLMVLNILWLLCCLPVFTFGPASSALARVMITLVRGGSEAVAKNYFIAFRRDFGRAVVLGLIGLAGLAIAVSDILFAVPLPDRRGSCQFPGVQLSCLYFCPARLF